MKRIFSKQTEKGITLIALVVTIVVLLILAGTSLDMLLGENGIIKQSQEAKQQTEISDEKESIQVAYNGLKAGDFNKTITAQEMEDEINRTKGANTVEVIGDETLTVKFLKSNRLYEINVTTGNIEDNIVDVESLFATATKPEEQVETDDIGIAEDGTIVNLDLWSYIKLDEKTIDLAPLELGSLGPVASSYGYKNLIKGEEIPLQEIEAEDGGKYYTIYGKIPMYIKIDGVIYIVKYMSGTFFDIQNLSYVPEIPSSVTDMSYTFCGCENLTTVPEIPSSVTDMNSTFRYCTNLTTAPEIPSSVTEMRHTFLGCTNLSGTLTINANPTNYYKCLYDAATNSTLKLNGTSTILEQILATKSDNSNITIEGQ